MCEMLTSPMFATLGQLNDVELDRLHVICGFKQNDSRYIKITELCTSKNRDTIVNYLKLNGHKLHPNIKGKEIPDAPDPNVCFEYSRHSDAIPLLLYLGSFKIGMKELQMLMEKYFHFNTQLIPDSAARSAIFHKGVYEIDPETILNQSEKLKKCAMAYGLSGVNVFYDPLYFDDKHESQGGWGIELSDKDVKRLGLQMISGDTFGSTMFAIPHAVQSNKVRIPRHR